MMGSPTGSVLGFDKEAERARYDASAPANDAEARDAYDWRHGSATMNRALRAPYRAVETRVSTMAAGRSVLDFGSGHGIYSVLPATSGAQVVGVDISPKSTAMAAERSRRAGVADRCRFVVGDCERLPFPAATFDLVLSMGTFSSLRHAIAFSELARVVKPAGEVILVDTLGHNPLLNLNRRLLHWRGRRTRWELDHIPTLRSFDQARDHFREVRVEYFGVTAPLIAPLCRGEGAMARGLAGLGEAVDRVVARFGPLRRLAFKFVCTLSDPITDRARKKA